MELKNAIMQRAGVWTATLEISTLRVKTNKEGVCQLRECSTTIIFIAESSNCIIIY